MNILTKIAIVVLLVLILITSVVFISHASTTANYRYAYEQQLARNKALEQHTQYATNKMNKYRLDFDELSEKLQEARSRLGANITDLQTRLSQQKQENAELQSDLDRINLKLENIEKTAALNRKRNDILTSQLDEAREKISTLQEELRHTEDTLKEKQALADKLEKNVRFLRGRIAELNEQNSNLRDQLAAGGVEKPGGAAPAPTPSVEISGTITAVKDNTASINVGSAKGVRDKMEMIIYRGGNLVGYLRIEEVNTTSAAGIIFNKQLQPMQGDKVTTSLD